MVEAHYAVCIEGGKIHIFGRYVDRSVLVEDTMRINVHIFNPSREVVSDNLVDDGRTSIPLDLCVCLLPFGPFAIEREEVVVT